MSSALTSYRSDIEGMRAIAIGLVLLYHAGVPVVSGGYVGVDVFFVLSGFLITGVMLRDVDRTGRLSLTVFWARRARRLLPAAFTALAGASLITWIWLPLSQREVFGKDIFSAAAYLVNWRLARRSVDYLDGGTSESPVLHFWSLAVEEQFYIVWPLVIVVALLLGRRIKMPPRIALGIVIGGAVVASLWWSVVETSQNPLHAYFSTFTRFWEIGLGAVVALTVHSLSRMPDHLLAIAGWIGLVGIGVSAVSLAAFTPFPSYWALLPTVSAALMLISGLRRVPRSPYRLLSTRPAVWLGGLSYSLYLWHWLALIAATAWWGRLSVQEGLMVIAASFVPSVLVHRLVENPIRFGSPMKRPRKALAVGAAFVAASAIGGILLVVSGPRYEGVEALELGEGAAALAEVDVGWSTVNSAAHIKPDPVFAGFDNPEARDDGCVAEVWSAEPLRCFYGDEQSDKLVMLVGDSKAEQWQPALRVIAEQSGWQLQVMTKNECVLSEVDQVRRFGRYSTCREWNEAVMQVIAHERPDLVIVSGRSREGIRQSEPDAVGATVETMIEGYAGRWRHLGELGISVAVILDNPGPGFQVNICVEQNRDMLSRCAFDLLPAVVNSGAQAQEAAANVPGVDVDVINLTDLICPQECPAVIGNVLVYRQSSHLTKTYVMSLGPYLAARLSEITEGILGGSTRS